MGERVPLVPCCVPTAQMESGPVGLKSQRDLTDGSFTCPWLVLAGHGPFPSSEPLSSDCVDESVFSLC